MKPAAIAFWREMPIAVTLTLALACCVSARDIVLDEDYTVIAASTNERLRLICGLKPRNQVHIVRWFFDGKPLDIQLRPRVVQLKQWLKIKSFRDEDAGVYTCHNEEDKGKEMSVTIKHKPDLSNIEEYQSDVDVLRPIQDILSQHSAPLVKKDINEENATDPRLKYQLYETTDDDIDASNEKSHLNNGYFDATKEKYAPKFKHPTRMFKMEIKPPGTTIRFKCVAEGNPMPNITWYKNNGTPISRSYFKPTYGKWYMEFEELTKADEGNYTCKVCNELGCIEYTYTLQIYKAMPEILSQHSAPLVENNTIEENATDPRLKYKEYDVTKDDDIDDKNEKEHLNYGHVDVTKSKYAPKFKHPTKLFKMEMKPAGSSIRFKCAAEGNPMPNITWYKNNGTPISRSFFKPSYGKWSMAIDELTKADNGNYTCKVCNELGCVEHTYTLHIQERYPSKPYIKEGHPGNVTVLVNETVTLTCPPVSDLEPYLYWLRPTNYTVKDTEVGPSDAPAPVGDFIESENPADKPEQLTIYNVTKEDEGWYVCVALNSLGNTTAKGYLTVLDSLPETKPLDHGKHSLLINVLTAVLGAMFFVAAIIVVMIFKRLKEEKIKKQLAIETARAVIVTHWTKKVTVEKPQMNGTQNTTEEGLLMPVVKIEKQKLSQVQSNCDAMMMSEYELPVDIDWEVPRESLSIGKVLGEGEFGKVVKAECVGIVKPGVQSVVAVKMLKEGHTDAEMMALVSEMEMMKMIGKHVNIINLLGCCTQDGPLYVIVEYAPNGNLREFLRNHRPGNRYESDVEDKTKKTLTQKDLVSYSYQIARGMEYLASRRCIHRDLAARNVLVTDDCVLKIADFGLAKDVHSNDYYRKKTEGRLPVRWMAPESLYHKVFTTQTDVWSFGVLLWEIMTLGGTPYPTVPGQYMYQHLSAGHRMEKPPCCSLEIYMLMRECWSFSPGDRPSFTELVEDLDKILTVTANQEYLDLGLPQLDTPPSSYDGSGDESDSEFPFIK
ncbi:fibroblast growth factor receptor homolog 1-like isoform X2 [Pararge aegeria]|uniref:fibroblast growth factor receptor homolog 1-like isoform X2 n=1 Tax=Pararge aegeria TaxID=116150 RepID=UPI0019D2B654|nr:fibroblast growth factor receptor homolog 1-like isoform X2 [Pararge aegeria]